MDFKIKWFKEPYPDIQDYNDEEDWWKAIEIYLRNAADEAERRAKRSGYFAIIFTVFLIIWLILWWL